MSKRTIQFSNAKIRQPVYLALGNDTDSEMVAVETVEAAEEPVAPRRRMLPKIQLRPFDRAQQLTVIQLGLFLLGVFIGLVVLGWWLWPVEWTEARFSDLAEHRQRIALLAAADLYAYDQRNQYAGALVGEWSGEAAAMACRMAAEETDVARQMRLVALVFAMNNYGCP